MPTKGTSVKGVRLPNSEWERLDAEAKKLKMTRNEMLGRVLTGATLCACSVQNSDEKRQNSDTVEFA